MKNFNFNLINKYIGIDIVEELIETNNEKYSTDVINFQKYNIIENNIDKFDLILCKDTLFHLSYNDVLLCLENFKNSKSRFLVSTSFYDFKNKNIESGYWRPINLEIESFNLGIPLIYWNNIENKTDGWINKGIGVWKLN